jgi:hypothetical protein
MKKIYILALPMLSMFANASIYKREFKTIDMEAKNITDIYIEKNDAFKQQLIEIDRLIEEERYNNAKELIKKVSKLDITDYVKGKIINKYSIILENTVGVKEAIKYLEEKIEKGLIKENAISETYMLLLTYNNMLNNSSKVKLYYDIIKKIYISDTKLQNLSDIEIAKYYIKKNDFNKAKSILENVLFNTKDSEIAAMASVVMSNIIFTENKDTKRIEKILLNIFNYDKYFFIKNKKLLLKNLSFLEKNINKSLIFRDIIKYMYQNLKIKNNKKEITNLGFLLFKVYMNKKQYKEAKDILLNMLERHDFLTQKDIEYIYILLDYIYSFEEMKRYDSLAKKYKNNKKSLNIISSIFYSNYLKNKDYKNLFKYYKSAKKIEDKYYNEVFLNKLEVFEEVDKLLFKGIFQTKEIKKEEKYEDLYIYLIKKYIDTYKYTFPTNNKIIKFLLDNKETSMNERLYNIYKDNKNILLNMSLIKLFAYSNIKYTNEYIEKILNSNDIRNKEKKFFFIAKINILLSNKELKEVAKLLEQADQYKVTESELKKIYYNYYLLLREYSVDVEYIEKILFKILNLSTTDIKYRPFIDFELIILQNEKMEYSKSIILLNNIPRKIFLNKEKKSKLYYYYAITYNELQEVDNRDKFLKKCISISEDNIWVQNCNFFYKNVSLKQD